MVKFASAPRPTLEDLERAFSFSGNVDQVEAKRAEDEDEDSHHDRVLYPPAAIIRDSADGSNVDILSGEASKSTSCERDETENQALQKELQILREKNALLERQLAAAEEVSKRRSTQLNARYHGHEEIIQDLKEQLSSLQVTYNLLQRTGIHTSVCETHEVPSSNNAGEATPSSSNAAGEKMERDERGMPPGGTVYGALISTPKLGVLFFKPQELTSSLFRGTAKEFVKELKERPVVAFMTEQSSAGAAGVKLGDILLKVNGVDVSSPEEANRLIRAGPRPLPLLFHVPNTKIGFVEGEFMVKYGKGTSAVPKRSMAWKTKYVVIGGIIAQPGMMQIFNSKVGYFVHLILCVYGFICGIIDSMFPNMQAVS